MPKSTPTRTRGSALVVWFLIELLVYAIVVMAYYFLVLHFLGGWLKQLFDERRVTYAIVALALIIVQGFVLEWLTSWLFTKTRGKAK